MTMPVHVGDKPVSKEVQRAIHSLKCAYLNQVGVEDIEAEESAVKFFYRLYAEGHSNESIIASLDIEAYRYEDM